jgi:hypothetical protein
MRIEHVLAGDLVWGWRSSQMLLPPTMEGSLSATGRAAGQRLL